MIGFWILAYLAVVNGIAEPDGHHQHGIHHETALDPAASEIHSRHQLEQRTKLSSESKETRHGQRPNSGSDSSESGEIPAGRNKRQTRSYIRSYPNPKSYTSKSQRMPRDYCDYFDDYDGYAYCCYY